MHRGAGVFAVHFSQRAQLGDFLAVGEGHHVFLAVAPHLDLEAFRKRVHHRHADAVQAAGIGVIFVRKFSAGVQSREDDFDAADAFFLMFVHRHAAAVVRGRERTVLVQRDVDAVAVAGDGLVHAVVDDFLRQMVRPAGVGVHPRPAADRVETSENFDGGGVVNSAHESTGLLIHVAFQTMDQIARRQRDRQ